MKPPSKKRVLRHHTSAFHPSQSNASASRIPGHARVKLHVSIKDLLVTADESGMRLDRFLKHRLDRDPELHATPINNTLINKWLRKRLVKLLPAAVAHDSTTAGPTSSAPHMSTVTTGTTRTEEGQLWRRHTETIGQPFQPLSDWIVYKDNRIIILNKPAGVAVQGGTGVQNSIDGSLSVLQEGFPDRPRLVHRLDRTTSGLLILARTRKAAQELTRRFHDGTTGTGTAGAGDGDGIGEESRESGLQKMVSIIDNYIFSLFMFAFLDAGYIAIVGSTHPRPIAGRMCTNKDGNEDPSSTDGQSRLSGNMIIVKEGKQERIEVQKENVDLTDGLARSSGPVWPSVTYFCIASQNVYNGMYYGVLRLYPRTGRKHQLRVHCAQLLKAPILGDKKYSDSKIMQIADESIGRIHLHMSKITLKV
ncbi:hypothetical protein BGZ67_007220 [Mortierella alpina]|nr:hypothetical protein BGZ67_007220 [Mortierella alpina]